MVLYAGIFHVCSAFHFCTVARNEQPNLMHFLPKPINPQTLQGMKKDSSAYETMNTVIASHNQLIKSLGPGTPISVGHFIGSPSVTVNTASGTVKRGKVMAQMGASAPANS